MNYLDNKTKVTANEDAVFNVYSYLAKKGEAPRENDTLKDIVDKLASDCKENGGWSEQEKYLLGVLQNAIVQSENLGEARIGNRFVSDGGMNACTFTKSDGSVSVVFAGTGKGEWIDNGEALSGIPEQNTYNTYKEGHIVDSNVVDKDYASDRQVEALNWFNQIASENGWDESTNITVSGHSKGGNKAQFITINSDLIDNCYSFDGQGFSPEALTSLENKYGDKFEERRQKILSFSSKNDYVNGLGEKLVPEDHVFYFEAPLGESDVLAYHFMEAMLDENGDFNVQCEKGDISEYIDSVSSELMAMDPLIRECAVLGVMNVCQKFLGSGTPVNADEVSNGETAIGLGLAAIPMFSNLLGTKDGHEAIQEIVRIYGDNIGDIYKKIEEEHGGLAAASAVILSISVVSFVTPFVINLGKAVVGTAWTINAIKDLSNYLKEISVEFYEGVKRFCSCVVEAVDKFFNNFDSGYKLAGKSPFIRVDTSKLRACARRLKAVNKRLGRLDGKMDELYLKVGLRDLFNLIQADLLTGSSWRIANCVKYLEGTADDFDSTEYEVADLFRG